MPNEAVQSWAEWNAAFEALKQRQEPGPPMTLGNMRELGVHHLIAYCHNDACKHQALIDVSNYLYNLEVR
jgi:hypothetical protein